MNSGSHPSTAVPGFQPTRWTLVVASQSGTEEARAALLEAQAGAQTGHVIEWDGAPVKKIRKAFAAAVKRAGLEGYGLTISAREPLVIAPRPENAHYLATKAERFGHDFSTH